MGFGLFELVFFFSTAERFWYLCQPLEYTVLTEHLQLETLRHDYTLRDFFFSISRVENNNVQQSKQVYKGTKQNKLVAHTLITAVILK